MDMKEMIARAMAAINGQDPDEALLPPPRTLIRWQAYLGDVERFLTTIQDAGMVIVPREPTEAMVRASYALEESTGFGSRRANIREEWQAMIDTAREGG